MYGFTPLGSVPAEKTSKSAPPSDRGRPPRSGCGRCCPCTRRARGWEPRTRAFLPSAASSTRGGDRGFEVDELAVEPVEVIALTGDRGALPRDERHQVPIDLAALETQPRHPAGILGAEAKPPQADHEPQPRKVFLGILAVAVRAVESAAAGCRPTRTSARPMGRCPRARRARRPSRHERTPSSHLKVKTSRPFRRDGYRIRGRRDGQASARSVVIWCRQFGVLFATALLD